jgi:hypothetical protein
MLPLSSLMFHNYDIGGGKNKMPIGYLYISDANAENEFLYTAAKAGMSYVAFKRKVDKEYWITGKDAVNTGFADGLALLKCGDSFKQPQVCKTDIMPTEGAFDIKQILGEKCPLDLE